MTIRIDNVMWTGAHREDIDSFDVDNMSMVELVEYFHNRRLRDFGNATFQQVSDEHVSISTEIADSELWTYINKVRPSFGRDPNSPHVAIIQAS